MPKFSLVLVQTSAVTIEAPSVDVLDRVLDGEMLTDVLEYLDTDPENWELSTQIKEGLPDAPVELHLTLKDGELVLLRVPRPHG